MIPDEGVRRIGKFFPNAQPNVTQYMAGPLKQALRRVAYAPDPEDIRALILLLDEHGIRVSGDVIELR